MNGYEQKCLAAGCTGFLMNPINIDLLLETVGQVLSGERVETALAIHKTPESDSEQHTKLNAAPLVSSLPVNIPRFAAVINTFVRRLEEELQTKQAAWETKAFKRMAELAHWLKRSGGTEGVAALTALATRLET